MVKRLKNSSRKGYTMLEIMIVVILIIVLITLGVNGYLNSVDKSRTMTAYNALDTYKNAFISTCVEYPGVISDRLDVWNTGTYTTKQALSNIVDKMNIILSDKQVFIWDNSLNAYRSEIEDPWGGYYVISEYPIFDGKDYYDPTTSEEKNIGIAIWASGKSNSVLQEGIINDNDLGVAILYTAEEISVDYTGGDGLFDCNEKLISGTIKFS